MSFIDKLKTRVEHVKTGIAEGLAEFTVPEEEQKARMVICIACPSLIQLTKTCKECGCFMTAKSRLKDVECPLKKW